MKFDSYPRFLRSHVFAECVLAEESGKPLPYEDGSTGDQQSSTNTSTEGGPVDSSPEQSDESKQSTSNSKQSKRRSFLPWARIKSSLVTAKAASLSSMPPKEASTVGSTFRRPMAVRKFASSITYKLRSRSLDEHIHNSASAARPSTASPLGSASTEKKGAALASHSSSVEQKTTRDSTLEESLDLDTAAPVFSPSPDALSGGIGSRVASLSSCSTSAEGSPVGSKPQHSSLLRVTFPDSSSTVIACTQPSESLGDLAHRLLLKRGFDLKEFEVFKAADNVVSLKWF